MVVAELLQSVYGFPPGEVSTLLDQEATREAILEAIESRLMADARPGDELVFYFAGHGSRVENPASDEIDGLDETLVPADSAVGAPDVHDKELRKIFNRALDSGAKVTVIVDACHSGSATRGGIPSEVRTIERPAGPRTVQGPYGPRIEERGALILAAAQDEQLAGGAFDHERREGRGAFTLAFQKAVRASWPGESAEHLFARLRAILQSSGTDQEPVLAGLPEVRRGAFLGGRSDRLDDRILVAVERVRPDGSAVVQGGWATGLTEGSELKLSDAKVERVEQRWRVVSLEGLAKSTVEPVAAAAQSLLERGTLLELETWASPPASRMRVWIREAEEWEAAESFAAALEEALAERRVAWLAEPSWDRRWDLYWSRLGCGHDQEARALERSCLPIELADSLSSEGIEQVFLHLPVPSGLGQLTMDGALQSFDLASDPREADYFLVARRWNGQVEVAWVRPRLNDGTAGLPPASAWLPLGPDLESTAVALRQAATRLARVAAWLRLESPPLDQFPYGVVLTTTDGSGRDLVGGTLVEGAPYGLALRLRSDMLSERPIPRRYVYVFSIDSTGRGTLLFPFPANVENRLPLEGEAPPRIPLAAEAFRVVAPFGTDTFLLLASDVPLPNIFALDFEGVRSLEGRSPLGEILAQALGQQRSDPVLTKSPWSIEKLFFCTRPR
jgi:hypothetical protein